MDFLAKIVNDFHLFTIFAKNLSQMFGWFLNTPLLLPIMYRDFQCKMATKAFQIQPSYNPSYNILSSIPIVSSLIQVLIKSFVIFKSELNFVQIYSLATSRNERIQERKSLIIKILSFSRDDDTRTNSLNLLHTSQCFYYRL